MKDSVEKKRSSKNMVMQVITCVIIVVIAAASLAALTTGYGLNPENFMGTEIFDFAEEELTEFSDTWFYDNVNRFFVLQKEVSTHKYDINRKMQAWKGLYITIDKMDPVNADALIVYYDRDGNIIAEQPVTLHIGENVIALYEDVEMYRMGIRVMGKLGNIISISSMQLRSELYEMDRDAFMRAFVIFAVMGAAVSVFIVYRSGRKKEEQTGFLRKLLCRINGEIQIYLIRKRKRNVCRKDQSLGRRIIFSILFLWMIWGDFSGIAADKTAYPWFALVCTVLVITIGVLCVGKKVQNKTWNGAVAAVWMALWIQVIISDIIVDEGIKFTGYIMLVAGGFFICCWNQMQKPLCVLREAMEAMEIDFLPVMICCIFFRPKRLSVYYHGMFRDAESFTIYSLLMYAIFLTEILWILQSETISKIVFVHITGAAVSLYMALRSGTTVTWTVIGIVSILYLAAFAKTVWQKVAVRKNLHIQEFVMLFAAAGLAFLVTAGVHEAIKYVPEKLGTGIILEDELSISSLSPDELGLYQAAFPGMFSDVVSKDTLDIRVYQTNYLRRLGLTGNIEQVKLYGKAIEAYNGYLEMAYRYGTLTVISFLLFQIYVLVESVRNKNILLLSVNIIYICFCMAGNLTIQLQQPVVWWVYLMNGCSFYLNKGKQFT